jgi:hypothetical protein
MSWPGSVADPAAWVTTEGSQLRGHLRGGVEGGEVTCLGHKEGGEMLGL